MNVKVIKVLRDIRDLNSLPSRRAQPKSTMLYLMELRSQSCQVMPPRRRAALSIAVKGWNDFYAMPVKITHL